MTPNTHPRRMTPDQAREALYGSNRANWPLDVLRASNDQKQRARTLNTHAVALADAANRAAGSFVSSESLRAAAGRVARLAPVDERINTALNGGVR